MYEKWRLHRMPYDVVMEFDLHDAAHCKRFYRSVRCKRHSPEYRPASSYALPLIAGVALWVVVMSLIVWIALYRG